MAIGEHFYPRADTGDGNFYVRKINVSDFSEDTNSGTSYGTFNMILGEKIHANNFGTSVIQYDNTLTEQWAETDNPTFSSGATSGESTDGVFYRNGNDYLVKVDKVDGSEKWVVGWTFTSDPFWLEGEDTVVGIDGSELRSYNDDGTENSSLSHTLGNSYDIDIENQAVDSNDNIYVVLGETDLYKIDPSSGSESLIYTATNDKVSSVRYLESGKLIISDVDSVGGQSGKISTLNTDGSGVTDIVSVGAAGQAYLEPLPNSEVLMSQTTNDEFKIINWDTESIDRTYQPPGGFANASQQPAMPYVAEFPSAWVGTEQITATPYQSTTTMNAAVGSFTILISSNQYTVSAVENDAVSSFELNSTQFTSSATPLDTSLVITLDATQPSTNALTLSGVTQDVLSITSTQVGATTVMESGFVDLFRIDATQYESPVSMEQPLLKQLKDASQFSVVASTNSSIIVVPNRANIGERNTVVADVNKTNAGLGVTKNSVTSDDNRN